jgi:hypothetical protein
VGGDVPPDMAEVFGLMTELGDEMFKHEESKSLRGPTTKDLFGNNERNALFANKIHPLSKIEALTISETGGPENQLKVHVDVNNDETEQGNEDNYNYVLCCFSHRFQEGTPPIREARLGYSRRSVGDFGRRETTCRNVIDNVIRPWVEECPDWRKEYSPDGCIFAPGYFEETAKVDNHCTYFPPTFNKQATFLSAFADSFLNYRDAYEKKQRQVMTMENQLEIILPVIFSTSALTYRTVLEEWAQDDKILAMSRTTNMTAFYIEYCN